VPTRFIGALPVDAKNCRQIACTFTVRFAICKKPLERNGAVANCFPKSSASRECFEKSQQMSRFARLQALARAKLKENRKVRVVCERQS
jgi:hypothetical protein